MKKVSMRKEKYVHLFGNYYGKIGDGPSTYYYESNGKYLMADYIEVNEKFYELTKSQQQTAVQNLRKVIIMENMEMKTSENLVSNSFTSEEYNLPLTRYEFYVLLASLPIHIARLNDINHDIEGDNNIGEQLCTFTSIYEKLCQINE